MTAQWAMRPLGEVLTLKRGYDLPERQRVPGLYPIISSSGPSGFHAAAKVQAPGIVTGRYGTLGEVFWVATPFWPLNTALYVRDFRGNNPRFLYYLLHSLDLAHFNDKSGVPGLNRNDLHEIEIVHPPIEDQRAIAHVLGALDDKIEANRTLNETLEATCQTLFRSWFIDFDPVVAKSEGRRPAHLTYDVAALFPDRFEDSPLGPVPESWRVTHLSSLCTTQYGYTASASLAPVGPHLLRVTDMNKKPWIEWATVPFCAIDATALEKYRLAPGDILVSRMADPGKAAIIETPHPDAVFASYLVRLSVEAALSYFVYYFLRSPAYLAYAEGAAGGTVQKNMNAKVITAAPLVLPGHHVTVAFHRCVSPLRDRIQHALEENTTLAALRDLLLPRLLSGEVRVRQAEQLVEEVV